eukprot:gene36904-44772_t
MSSVFFISIALVAFLSSRVGAVETAESPRLAFPHPLVIKESDQVFASDFFAEYFLRGSKSAELEEVVDSVSTLDADPQFAKYAYYENDQCTGFIKSMISVKLATCMKVKNQKVSFTFSVSVDGGMAIVNQQVYSDAKCKTAFGAPTPVFQAPAGCNSVGGLYAEPTIVSELPTHAEFAGGVRVTVYNTQESCLLDQDPSDGGNRLDPPEENVLEMDFSTNGYCWADNEAVGSDAKFISCERNSSPSGDSNTFVVETYPSTDGSCSGAATTFRLRKRNFCRKRKETFAGLGLGYMSMTCY